MQNCSMLPHDVFASVVRHAPLVSIDLVVRNPRGEILVGLRRNRPAQGYWFVPGGRIGKGERIAEAFARITRAELGIEHRIEDATFLGVFDHIYPGQFQWRPVVRHPLCRTRLCLRRRSDCARAAAGPT